MKDPVALNLNMIVTIVDGGMGYEVIKFSKTAGAVGGTILHGRGSGIHDSSNFLGLEISPEKDIVLTLVPDSLTNQVMETIGQGINMMCQEMVSVLVLMSIKSLGSLKSTNIGK